MNVITMTRELVPAGKKKSWTGNTHSKKWLENEELR